MNSLQWTVSFALCAAILAGCASSGSGPMTMQDPEANFAAFKTFGWDAEPNADGSAKTLSLLDSNIRSALTAELNRKGYAEAAEGATPDLLVLYETAAAEKIKTNPFRIGIGAGSYGSGGGGGVSVGSPAAKNVKEGSLVLRAIDPAKKAEVWRGSVSRELGKGNVEPAVVRTAVAELLADFPARAPEP